jgi:hypothetical protein
MYGPIAIGLVLVTVASVCAEESSGEAGAAQAEQARIQESHRAFSVSCFNDCWTLMDKADRTPDDVENMVLLAQASLWHWKQRADCQPVNLSVGYWQVSRAHALAGHREMARLFAESCLRVSQEKSLPPFYVGYGYEALARAAAINRETAVAAANLAKARKQLSLVADEEEKGILAADLDALDRMVAGK